MRRGLDWKYFDKELFGDPQKHQFRALGHFRLNRANNIAVGGWRGIESLDSFLPSLSVLGSRVIGRRINR